MSESAAPPEASSSGGLFTRQSSGLVRELGIPAATAIALASVAVVNTFINFSAGLTSFSHPDMVLPLLLAAGIWFVAMFAYQYLLQAIPRAGGEYVYVSRVISPVLGAMVGIGVAVAFTYILAANAQFTAAFMPFALTGLGDAFSSSWIAAGANHVTSKDRDRAHLRRPARSSSGCSRSCRCAGSRRSSSASSSSSCSRSSHSAASCLPTPTATSSARSAASATTPNAYNAVLSAAKHNGVVTGISLTASLLVVPFMVLNYNGVLYSYYVGGELKRPGRTYM